MAENKTLHSLIERMARKSPTATALIQDGTQLSYAAINTAADSLCGKLQSLDSFQAGSGIGIVGRHGIEQIIAMIAVSKSGCWFLPVDPDLPTSRIDEMLEDAVINIVIDRAVDALMVAGFETSGHENTPSLIKLTLQTRLEGSGLLSNSKSIFSHAAYCIYTSGSTGKPKGALIPQDGVTHIVEQLAIAYHIVPTSRVLQFASLAFDASISEIFTALAAGASICIPPDSTVKDLDKLSAFIIDTDVSVGILPSSIVTYMNDETLAKLETLVVAGEACSLTLAKRAIGLVPHFINAYGPTETSICATTYEATSGDMGDVVPIGQALPGVNLSIRDPEGNPVISGESGELYIGGRGVFIGYLNDIARTDAALCLDSNDESYYRTGDLVRMSPTSGLLYLGRIDNQIKLHGIRLSPEDIENSLLHALPITACIVVKTQNNQLACYYTGKNGMSVTQARELLADKLPSYAIPSRFIELKQLPLTSNGKIDRRAINNMDQPPIANKQIISTDLNERALSLWSEVLGTGEVNSQGNFYDLGGDSLNAMILVSRLNDELKLNATVVDLMQHPDFSDFLDRVKKNSTVDLESHDDSSQLTDYERLFYSSSILSPAPAAYTLTEVMTITDVEDFDRLKRAALDLISSHTALRTNFVHEGTALRRVVKETIDDSFYQQVADSQCTNGSMPELIDRIANEAIDLANDPLLFMYELRPDSKTVIIIWHVHHIVTDSYGMSQLLAQYVDILKSEKSLEPTDDKRPALRTRKDSEKFWQSYFTDNIELTSLPWDYSRPVLSSGSGNTLVKNLPKPYSTMIRDCAQLMGMTPFSVVHSIFAILMHRLSGQDNVLIGTAVTLRDILHTDTDIGPYLNTLPIIARAYPGDIVETYVNRLHHELLSCATHKDMPLHRIVELGASADKLSAELPFNIMFDYIAHNDQNLVTTHQSYSKTAKFDLSLTVIQESYGYELVWEYDTALFRHSTIERLHLYFETLLQAVTQDFSASIETLALLPVAEYTLVTDTFNNTDSVIPDRTYIQKFASTLEKFADKTAVTAGSNAITYRELDRLSGRLADRLMAAGVGVEAPVGIYMNRSIELIVSVLAIWKVRAAYVPIEPDYPADRVGQIIKQAAIKHVICDANSGLSSFSDELIIMTINNLDDDNGVDEDLFSSRLDDSSVSDLAYIIFTSGSTGIPKGVMIEQLGMMNHLFGMIDYLELSEETILAQTASHTFDISVWQLVAPLLIGGQVVIYSKMEQLDPLSFITSLKIDQITIAELVPSYLTVFLDYIANSDKEAFRLKYMLVTGEAAFTQLINRWQALCPTIPLINAYGPAEASDDTHLHRFISEDATGFSTVPVGKSLPNIRSYVVDKNILPVPIGVKGEICIAGVAVGRGYVNEPDKTADSFMMNPFRTDQKERMYRTGDIGSWREDGALYYHGRSDYQVKIRGFRIELGDIESQLLVNPKVKEAAVIINETKQNTKTLVAFYSGDIEAVILREYIQSKLPGYLVPNSFHRLETLPKNNSGKIDRKILTHTQNVDADRTELSVSPNEQIIAEVWAEVLGIPIPATNDNFFKLGGDSIACFQIINRLAVRGYQLSVRDIFSHPTVSELARMMKSEPVISAIDKVILDEPFPLSPVQALSLQTHKAVRLRQNQVVVVKTGPLDKNKLEQALLETIKCHPMLYAQLIEANNEYKQVLRNPSQLRFILETSTGDIDANRSQFINQIAQSIDASNGQMFAAGIITDIGNVELYLVAHHFACDAISWDIFLNDLEQNYQAMVQGTDITPMNEYTSYQYWVTQLLKTSFDHDQDYWQDVIDLAQNFKAPLLTSQSYEVVPELTFINEVVSENVESDLGDLIRKYDNESLVHSIFALALGRWTSTTAVSYMNEKHGRDISSKTMNLSQSIGWFTALYPVSITTEATFERQVIEMQQYLKQVKKPHGYGVLRTYGKRPLVGNEPPITLNYLGRMDRDNQPSIFGNYTLTYEGAIEADSFNSAAIECNIAWNQAALDVEIAYRRDKVDTHSIKDLIQHMKNIISEVKISTQTTDGAENSFGISENRLNGILGRLKTSSED